MGRLVPMVIATVLGGCAARVPVTVPAAPSVLVPTFAVSVVAVDRECRQVADELAAALGSLEVMRVQPDATTRLRVFGCGVAWRPVAVDTDCSACVLSGEASPVVEGSAQAVVTVSDAASPGDPVVANLLGASRVSLRAPDGALHTLARLPRNLEDDLIHDVAVDLAEQIAPVSTEVHRRIYVDPANGSARQFHNLAVDAELNGQLADAVWWATRAWERRPSPRSARYLAELTRRLSRSSPPL